MIVIICVYLKIPIFQSVPHLAYLIYKLTSLDNRKKKTHEKLGYKEVKQLPLGCTAHQWRKTQI